MVGVTAAELPCFAKSQDCPFGAHGQSRDTITFGQIRYFGFLRQVPASYEQVVDMISRKSGFTLVELLVVIAIIAILVTRRELVSRAGFNMDMLK